MQLKQLPVVRGIELSFCVIAAICIAMLAGCGYSGSSSVNGAAIGGNVHGGRQPVIGSHIQLYAAGTSGDGSAAQAISEAVKSDIDGNFSIPAAYKCPSATSPVYIVARGGTWTFSRQQFGPRAHGHVGSLWRSLHLPYGLGK